MKIICKIFIFFLTGEIIFTIDIIKKTISTGVSSTTSTSSGIGGSSGERKNIGGYSATSNLKRLVGDAGTNNGNGNTNIALGEELDGVERGEGAPLSHLTASRAKAPHRRPPSSQRLRRHAAGPTITTTPVSVFGTSLISNTYINHHLKYLYFLKYIIYNIYYLYNIGR